MSDLEEAKTEVLKTDVLVLGGGIAGCFAAIKAKESGLDVVLVDKGNLGRSGLSPMMSGVLTYFDPAEDNYDEWYKECVEASDWIADQKVLDGMISETTRCIRDMDDWGVKFQKEGDRFIRKPMVGHIHARNILMTNGGLQMMSVVRGEVLRRGARVIERVMATDLLTSDGQLPTKGRVIGSIGFNIRTGKFYIFKAKATVIATGMMFMIIVGAKAFAQILAFTGVSDGLLEFTVGLSVAPLFTIIAIQIVVLFLGCFMDPVAIMMITLPIFVPVIHALGFDPVWFGVVMLLNLEMALITPPYGISLFVMKGVAPPDTTMGDIYKASLPFVGCNLIVMTLLISFPALVLWLPGVMR